MKEQTFSKQLSECRKSLATLVSESEQTLALLLVAKKFPDDHERKTALQQQCHREDRLLSGYQCRRNELLRQVIPATPQAGGATPGIDSGALH